MATDRMPSETIATSEVIAIACDHAGLDLKTALVEELHGLGYRVLDLGTNEPASVDYPDFADALAQAVRENKAGRGVLVCGSGVGISIAANRHPEIRAALVHDTQGARLARQHNDANVVVFGGRMIELDTAKDCLREFLTVEFEGGRHQARVAKLSKPV